MFLWVTESVTTERAANMAPHDGAARLKRILLQIPMIFTTMLITYGKTKFLFTGDIEENAQTRISDRYENENDKDYDIDLIKMPHHGSYTGTLY